MADVNFKISATDEASGPISKAASSLDGLKTAALAAASAFGAYKLASLIQDSTMLAARNETLAVVLRKVGENAGYTSEQSDGYARAVAKMGITVEGSRLSITKMAQANLDLSKSADLARMSQDAAVIAGTNSSQALEGILHGITTLQPEVLRTYGIVVNFEQAYAKAAATMNRSVDSLTQAEKQQIAMNAALEQGKSIAGVYEASLGTVGKAILSLKRYVEDNKAAFGEVFTPALKIIVDQFTQSLKDLGAWFLSHKEDIHAFAKVLSDEVKTAMDLVVGGAKLLIENLDLIKGVATVAGIALAGLATSAIISSVGSLIAKFVELRLVILAASAANVTMAGSQVSTLAGTAAGLSRGGVVGLGVGVGMAAYAAGSYVRESAVGRAMGLNTTNPEGDAEEALSKKRLAEATALLKAKEDGEKSAAAAAEGMAAKLMKDLADKEFMEQQQAKKTYEARKGLADEYVKYEITSAKNLSGLKMDLLRTEFEQGQVNAATSKKYYDAVVNTAHESLVGETRLLELQKQRIQSDMNGNMSAEQKIKNQTELVKINEQELEIKNKYAKVLADTAQKELDLLKSKKKEIEEIQAAFKASNDNFSELKAKFTGDYSGDNKHLDPTATASEKFNSLKDKLAREEAAANELTDPGKKAEKLKALSDSWGQLLTQIDGANLSTGQKMQMINDIEEQRNRIQNQVLSAAEAEKTAMEANYNAAISKVQEYRNEMIALDNVIKNMTRDITVNLKVNKSGLSGGAGGSGGGVSAKGQADAATGVTPGGVNDFSGTPYGGRSGYSGAYNYDGNGNAGTVVNGQFYAGSYNSYTPGQALPGSWRQTGDGSYSDGNGNSMSSSPSTPSYEVGTNYVPEDGLAFLHEGEAVVPKKYNGGGSGGGSITIQGGITIQVPAGTPQEMAKEAARLILPEFQKLQARYRKVA